MTAFWIALAVFVAGVLGGLVYAAMRGLSLWRRIKLTGGALSVESDRIAAVSAEIQTHLDRASASGGRLAEAGARLASSRTRLDVQLQALREARHTMQRLFWFLPGI